MLVDVTTTTRPSARRGPRTEAVLSGVGGRELSDESRSTPRASSESVEDATTGRLPTSLVEHRVSQGVLSWARQVLAGTHGQVQTGGHGSVVTGRTSWRVRRRTPGACYCVKLRKL